MDFSSTVMTVRLVEKRNTKKITLKSYFLFYQFIFRGRGKRTQYVRNWFIQLPGKSDFTYSHIIMSGYMQTETHGWPKNVWFGRFPFGAPPLVASDIVNPAKQGVAENRKPYRNQILLLTFYATDSLARQQNKKNDRITIKEHKRNKLIYYTNKYQSILKWISQNYSKENVSAHLEWTPLFPL